MRSTKIIAAILVLIGFGSCANRPSKSKAPENTPEQTTMQADTTEIMPIMIMYGPPRPRMEPQKEVREKDARQEGGKTAEGSAE